MNIHHNFIENRAPILGAHSLHSSLTAAGAGAAAGSSFGPWGAAIGAAGGLLSGLFSSNSQKRTNEMNYKIAKEQMEFNREEAQKNRDWQEEYYKKYSSPTALAAQYRAGGLNAQLMGVQPGSVASGSTASAGELPVMGNAGAYLGQGIQSGLSSAVDTYQRQQQIDSQTSLNSSLESLQGAQKAYTEASEQLTKTQNESEKQRVEQLRQTVNLMVATFDSNVKKAFQEAEASAWETMDLQYKTRSTIFSYYNILPEQQKVLQNQSLNLAALTYKAYAEGDLSLKELELMPKRLAIEQTRALADMLDANANMLSARNQGSYLNSLSKFVDSQKQEVDNRNAAFNLPLMHNGKLTKAGYGLQYVLYNQNKAALRYSLKMPQFLQKRMQLLDDEHGLLGYKKLGYVTKGVNDLGGAAKDVGETVLDFKKGTGRVKQTERFDRDGFYTGGSITYNKPWNYRYK